MFLLMLAVAGSIPLGLEIPKTRLQPKRGTSEPSTIKPSVPVGAMLGVLTAGAGVPCPKGENKS